ncbi:MAG: hypothetical protein ACTSYQ_04395 [Candidatus Odinarchaeia archaeon]
MPTYIRGFMLNRLLILILAFLTPVYFYLLVYFSGLNIASSSIIQNELLNTFFNYGVVPFIFSSPWLIFIYIFRNRLANTFSNWAERSSVVPLRWLIFYGVNTLIIACFFILPYITPILSIFGGIVLGWNIISKNEFLWSHSRKIIIFVSFFLFALLLSIPIMISILFYPSVIVLSSWILNNWIQLSNLFYAFSIWVVNSITLGTSFWLIYCIVTRKSIVDMFSEVNITTRIIEIILFLIFAFLWLPQLGNMPQVIDFVNIISLGITCILVIIKLKYGLSGSNFSVLGIIIAGSFLVIDLLYRFNLLILTIAFVLTAVIFIISFLYVFLKSSDELEI